MLEDAESRPTSWARDEGFDKAYDEAHDEGVHCVRSLITSGRGLSASPCLPFSLSPRPPLRVSVLQSGGGEAKGLGSVFSNSLY